SGSNGDPSYAAQSGEIKVWDLEAGKELLTLRERRTGVFAVALSPDGKRLVSANWGSAFPGEGLPGEIKVWDLEQDKEITTLSHTRLVALPAVTADGRHLFSSGLIAYVKVWDLEAGKELIDLGETGAGSGLALSGDGKRLAWGAQLKTIKVWDVQTGQ